MKVQLIRNATMRIHYKNTLFLTDPFLAPKFTIETFAGISENPMVDLPMMPQEVIEGIDFVLLSHLHVDHFDLMAQRILDKDTPIYCQQNDELRVEAYDFDNVIPIDERVFVGGMEIVRVEGMHGSGEWAEKMKQVSGYILSAEGEPTVYWCGDTIWYPEIANTIKKYSPDIIITHSSGAKFKDSDYIVMDDKQTIKVCEIAGNAKVIAVHMETLDHGTVDRVSLATNAAAEGINADQLFIPMDGEELIFNV